MVSTRELLRGMDGRFTGEAAQPFAGDLAQTDYADLDTARDSLRVDTRDMIRDLIENGTFKGGGTQTVPAAVVAASPGAGKSRIAREVLTQDFANERIDFYAPTLALAAEACDHSVDLGADAALFRGRSAIGIGGQPLCRKSKLVETAARLGIPIMKSFCRREDGEGTELVCEHYRDCPYIAQRATSEAARQRYMATSRLNLEFGDHALTEEGEDAADTDLAVVDETFWRGQLRIKDVKFSEFAVPRTHMPSSRMLRRGRGIDDLHADLLVDASKLVACLAKGDNPMDLPFTAEHLRKNARLEWAAATPDAGILPDQETATQKDLVSKRELTLRRAGNFARVWSVLAEAREQGRGECERLRLAERDGETTIRTFGTVKLPQKAPFLVLDADADREILSALGLEMREESRFELRPNAHVVQIHDRSMGTTKLKTSRRLRDEWGAIIAREVLADRQLGKGGVLVGASRRVVKMFFQDAGYDFSGKSEDEASRQMLDTELLGARWLWFGSRSLGLNTYRDYGTAIVIGREELPVSALEDMGRALFGDRVGRALRLVEPDEQGNLILPQQVVPYEMSARARAFGGQTWAASVPCHPDPLIRRIQIQARELATRQLVERLRLAHAKTPRRVILGSRIPIPGLPVDELVLWNVFKATRAESLFLWALGFTGGIRSSARGLFEDAAGIFNSLESAKKAVNRMDIGTDLLRSQTAILLGDRLKQVEIHEERLRARKQQAFLIAENADDARRKAEEMWGPMRSLTVL